MILIGLKGDPTILAALGIGNVYINVLVQSIGFGMNFGLISLVSQALGKSEYKLVAAYVHKICLLQILLYIPFAVLFFFSGPILRAVGM